MNKTNQSFPHSGRPKPTMYAAMYEIKIPGHLEAQLAAWIGGMTITVEHDEHGLPVTTLTGAVDQAALQGLLRRLYALGLPLISVTWIGDWEEMKGARA
jgi:hypothetical protein